MNQPKKCELCGDIVTERFRVPFIDDVDEEGRPTYVTMLVGAECVSDEMADYAFQHPEGGE